VVSEGATEEAVATILEFARKWAESKRRDREAFDRAAPLVRALLALKGANVRSEFIREIQKFEERFVRGGKVQLSQTMVHDAHEALQMLYDVLSGLEIDLARYGIGGDVFDRDRQHNPEDI
jgi:hypothetical protein